MYLSWKLNIAHFKHLFLLVSFSTPEVLNRSLENDAGLHLREHKWAWMSASKTPGILSVPRLGHFLQGCNHQGEKKPHSSGKGMLTLCIIGSLLAPMEILK